MFFRSLRACLLICTMLLSVACGGAPRAATADLAPLLQPTPDPTLDAVVRNLPRALAGAPAATATPTPRAALVAPTAAPPARRATPAPTMVPTRAPTPRQPTPIPTKTRP